MMKNIFWVVCITLLLLVCSKKRMDVPENVLFTRLLPKTTGINFSNDINPTQEFNIFTYRNFYNGGGVALGDINSDGLVDIYFTANQGKNRLYLNEGNFQFRDITKAAGVAGNRFWTTGVTMADVNGDGLLDIYVLNSGDIQGNDRKNELFINQGDLTFKDEAAKYNLDYNSFSVHATFFDYDGDGDLDCYLVNNSFTGTNMDEQLRKTRDEVHELGGDILLRNDDGIFIDVSEEAGIYRGEIGFGLGVMVGDLTGDHQPDIYISNDFWERDYLYINQGDGTFREELVERTSHISQSSMGSDMADIDNDGRLDIFVTDMLPADNRRTKTMTVFDDYHVEDMGYHGSYHYQYVQNTLQVNNGNGMFTEMAFISGVAATDWSWGTLMFDFSNDGWNDIFVSNGIYRDITDMDFRNFISDRNNIARIVRESGEFNILDFLERMPSEKIKNAAFVNNKDKTFSNKSDSLGFYEPSFSSGAAYGDLDNDGDLDLVINNLNGEAFVYKNNAEKYHANHYLKVKFEGEGNNLLGVGTHVKIFASGEQQVAENIPSRSFQSAVPHQVHFGLGKELVVDSLVVIWPDHRMQVLKNVETDRGITVKQQAADRKFMPADAETKKPVIGNVTGTSITGDIKHHEDEYIDFNHQRLLPRMLSVEGPKLVVGDINGNGLEDFFITGALNDRDKIFIQQTEGQFTQLTSPDIEQDSIYESTAAAFLDIDGDGTLDLVVGNGGNQFDLNSEYHKIRVYQNNGEGIFTRSEHLEPDIHISASCIVAEDFNNDGHMDVFIGARVEPKNYGMNPRSYLLQNDGQGNWIDVTPEKLKRAGMITDAAWTDYNRNGDSDLIIVGEWMPITFYNNKDGKLEYDYSIGQSSGWWTAIKRADLDGDGDMDFVLGNWGLNSKFQATPDRPVTMYVNDFDGNNKTDFIINTFLSGEEKAYPFHTYSDITTQLPVLKDKILKHHDYAEKTYDNLFTYGQRNGAEKKEIQTLHTSLLINNDGEYELKELPLEAQLSPVYGIIAEDFNSDNNIDLLLLGNFHSLKPEAGRLAGNHGVFLFSNGGLNYTYKPYHETNTFIEGEVRDVTIVNAGNDRLIVIARNNDEILIFK